MNTFGRQVISNTGTSLSLSSDGAPERKSGGITIDWSCVTPQSGDTTLNDGVVVKDGEKALRYGQVVAKITTGEITVLTVSNATLSPMSGNFTLSVGGNSTANLAFNASNVSVRAAVENLTIASGSNVTVGVGNVSLSGAAGGPYTLTFSTALGNVALSGSNAGLTNGSLSFNTTSQGGRDGLWGPYDPAAVDGRQTLDRATSFIINITVKEEDTKSAHPDVLLGGEIFKERLIATTGSASLANGPTFTDIYTYFPRLILKA